MELNVHCVVVVQYPRMPLINVVVAIIILGSHQATRATNLGVNIVDLIQIYMLAEPRLFGAVVNAVYNHMVCGMCENKIQICASLERKPILSTFYKFSVIHDIDQMLRTFLDLIPKVALCQISGKRFQISWIVFNVNWSMDSRKWNFDSPWSSRVPDR